MSFQYDEIRAEMEVNRIRQNVIVAHHLIQAVNLVVGVIICGATSHFLLMGAYLFSIAPALVFVIIWIASKCNYKDLRLILVHFNWILSILWFIAVLQIFITSIKVFNGMYIYDYSTESIISAMEMYEYRYSAEFYVVPLVLAIVNGILSLSSIYFAVCAIWKAARNVVLKAKLATLQHIDGHILSPIP